MDKVKSEEVARKCHRLRSYFFSFSTLASRTVCNACLGPTEAHRDEPCPDTQQDFAYLTYCVKCNGHRDVHPKSGAGTQVPSALESTSAMRFGVYKKLEGKTGVGMLYQFLLLARHHTTGDHYVVYIPLRIEPEWSGTIRPSILERAEFERKFEFVGEALP